METEWDSERRQVKKIHPQASSINAAILYMMADIQKAIDTLTHQGQHITAMGIKKIMAGQSPGFDFFAYCMDIIPMKYPEKRQSATRRTYYGELSKLKVYAPKLNIYDITIPFLQGYRAYLLNELGNHPNTVWKAFKCMRSLINEAIKTDVYNGENPFRKFDIGRYKQGKRNYMELSHCDAIESLLKSNLPEAVRHVGYYYLFMAYTGLRFGDAMRFDRTHILDNERIYIKTQKKGEFVNIKINKRIRPVLDFILTHPFKMSNKEFNKYLKVIGELACIPFPLTAHVGRHTFGAMLAEMETPKEVAQKLLGHADIRSTSIYYHMKDKSLDNAMDNWDRM
jgi:integrase